MNASGNAWVVKRSELAPPGASGPWFRMNGHGVPLEEVLIWPGSTPPGNAVPAIGFARSGLSKTVRRDTAGAKHYGKVETMAVEQAPHGVVHTALRAAAQMGDGLYGVDLKSIGSQVLVMEVNDNPSIEAGYEDRVLGDELYRRIIATFVARLEQRGQR